jgi:RHS repeat-associated protein
MPTGSSAYTYDRDGRLVQDVKENLTMNWTVDNKIGQVQKSSTVFVRYLYDAAGNRVLKRLPNDTAEYVVRDGTGNELERITRRNNSTANPIWVRTEASLYGSTRFGTLNYPTSITPDTVETRGTGRNSYEISDHLGNVRVTLSDLKTFTTAGLPANTYRLDAAIQSANDYYPFGLPSRTFQPGYKLAGGRMQDYGFRAYRPDLGRFFAVDPLAREYPYYTPYQFGGNDVIRFIDRDGLEPASPGYEVGATSLAIVRPGQGITESSVGTEANWVWDGNNWGRLSNGGEKVHKVTAFESFLISWNQAVERDFVGDGNGLWNDQISFPAQEGFRIDYGDNGIVGDPGVNFGENKGPFSTETDDTPMPGGAPQPGPSQGSTGWGKSLSQGIEGVKGTILNGMDFFNESELFPSDSGTYLSPGWQEKDGVSRHYVGPLLPLGGVNPSAARPATKVDSVKYNIE